jgi:hypothetical protein
MRRMRQVILSLLFYPKSTEILKVFLDSLSMGRDSISSECCDPELAFQKFHPSTSISAA